MPNDMNRGNAVPGTVPEIRWVVEFDRCDDIQQLHVVMDMINRCQYQLISVAQDSNDIWTVFWRRCLVGQGTA